MFGSVMIGAFLFEAGTWLGFGVSKFGSREKNQNILINGYDARRSIAGVDGMLAKKSTHATKWQRTAADRLGILIRAFVNTRAFELLLLQKISEAWPGKKSLDEEVTLFV